MQPLRASDLCIVNDENLIVKNQDKNNPLHGIVTLTLLLSKCKNIREYLQENLRFKYAVLNKHNDEVNFGKDKTRSSNSTND